MGKFDGLEDFITPEEREHYEPGKLPYDSEALDNLVNKFSRLSDMDIINEYSFGNIWVERFTDVVNGFPEEDFDAQAFLDALVEGILKKTTLEHITFSSCLLDPAVQALYDLGYNEFIIDLSRVPITPKYMANDLIGQPGKPLKLLYKGNATEFGINVKYCEMEIVGDCHYGGTQANRSSITFSGDAKNIAGFASTTDFIMEAELIYALDTPSPCFKCNFKITDAVKKEHVEELMFERFFEDNNKLYKKTKAGNWKEVKAV